MERLTKREDTKEDIIFSALLEEIKNHIKENLTCVDLYKLRFSKIMDFIWWAKRNHNIQIPDNIELVFDKMYIYLKNNDPQKALDFIEEILDIWHNKVYMILKCFLLLELEKPNEAVEFIDYVLNSDSQLFLEDESLIDKQVTVLYNTWKEFLLLKKYKDALAYFHECTTLKDDNIDVIYDKWICLLNLGRYSEALGCFDEILKIDSEFKQATWAKKRTQIIMDIEMRKGNIII